MVLLHSLWLVSIVIAYLYQWTEFNQWSFSLGFFFFTIGQTLRMVAIKTLKGRWTTRIVILPKAPAIHSGIFKYFRHPNYLGVCFEVFALPLMAGMYSVSIIFSIINLIILKFRIQKEEESLNAYNDYSKLFKINKKKSNGTS